MRIPSSIRRAIGLTPWPAGGVVLAYHRVACLERDPQQLAVTPQAFADHLAIIREHGHPLPLSRLVELAEHDAVPPGAVAVTFDDGYADTLHVAAPLLVRFAVPATVFVSTGAIDRGREFWWDELERFLLGASPSAARTREYEDACAALRRLDDADRERVLDDLARRAGDERAPRPSHRPLTPDEVTALSQIGGVTVGSHTVSHAALAHLGERAQRAEIADARRRVESLTGIAAASLAYPFGDAAAVSPRTRAIAADEGITLACVTRPDTVRRGVDRLRVPRMTVRNWSLAEFLARWSAWAGLGNAA